MNVIRNRTLLVMKRICYQLPLRQFRNSIQSSQQMKEVNTNTDSIIPNTLSGGKKNFKQRLDAIIDDDRIPMYMGFAMIAGAHVLLFMYYFSDEFKEDYKDAEFVPIDGHIIAVKKFFKRNYNRIVCFILQQPMPEETPDEVPERTIGKLGGILR